MNRSMTLERATEFGAAWNSGDADLIASFFTEDGAFHSTDGPEHLGMSFVGRGAVRNGAQMLFDAYPDGRFENLKVTVAGNIGTFEWEFVTSDELGNPLTTVGCDLLEFRDDMVVNKNAFRKARV